MSVFSKHNRYREAGEPINFNNLERFGQPVRSLFTSTKVFSMHHHINITDEAEHIVYQARSKALSFHDRTQLTDMAGNVIAEITKKPLSLHERHTITMADGLQFQLSSELFHLVQDIMNIEGLGWQMRGNFLGLNFELYDRNDAIIAVISQKMVSLHDKYCIDIYRPELEPVAVAILVTLQHMIRDRETAAASSSS